MAAKDYYSLLQVPRTATLRDIETAYRRLRPTLDADPERSELERAFDVLRQPNLKRKYDSALDEGRIALNEKTAQATQAREASRAAPKERAPARPLTSAQRFGILAVLLGALGLLFAVQIWPMIAWRFRVYAPGTSLVNSHPPYAPFGQVLAFEDGHAFPEGRSADAYEVRLVTGDQAWIPRQDLNRLTVPTEQKPNQ